MSNAPAITLAGAMKTEVVIGSIGKSNTTCQWPALANSVLGNKFKIVSGYRSGGAIYKAMESGEVHGYAPVWLSLTSTKAAWLKEKKVAILTQAGLTAIKGLEHVPMLIHLAKTEEQKSIIRFLAAGGPLGRSALTTPGVPKARLAALRSAFKATMTDPKYLADAKKRKLTIQPYSRKQVEAAVEQVINTSPALLAKIKTILGY